MNRITVILVLCIWHNLRSTYTLVTSCLAYDLMQILSRGRCILKHTAQSRTHIQAGQQKAKAVCDARARRVGLTINAWVSVSACDMRETQNSEIAFFPSSVATNKTETCISPRELTIDCNIQRFQTAAAYKYQLYARLRQGSDVLCLWCAACNAQNAFFTFFKVYPNQLPMTSSHYILLTVKHLRNFVLTADQDLSFQGVLQFDIPLYQGYRAYLL